MGIDCIVSFSRRSVESDGAGGRKSKGYSAPYLAGHSCRIDLSSGRLVRNEAGEEVQSTHNLIGNPRDPVPEGITVKAGDLVTDDRGRRFVVLLTDQPAGWNEGSHLEAVLQQIGG